MDEEQNLQPADAQQTETTTTFKTEPIPSLDEETLAQMPSLDDLIKSEKQITPAPELQGLKRVESETSPQDKTFARKDAKKKELVKKRLKIITGVYIAVCALLLALTFVNLGTMINKNSEINANKATIQSEQTMVNRYETSEEDPLTPSSQLIVDLNEPRDYSDEKKELTFLDKLSILFRNLFG